MGIHASFLQTSDNSLIGYRLQSPLGCFDISEDFCAKNNIVIPSSGAKRVSIIDNAFRTGVTDTVQQTEDINLVRLLLDNSIVCEYGDIFAARHEQYFNFKRRFCFDILYDSVVSAFNNITILYGVRRTGKSVLLYQLVQELLARGVSSERIACIELQFNTSVDDDHMQDYLSALINLGVKYVIIDELTFVRGNLGWLSFLSSQYHDIRFVLTGTDSLGLHYAHLGSCFKRDNFIHTTYISYKEFRHLYGDVDIQSFIKSGGILSWDSVYAKEHSFIDLVSESKGFIESSILRNIFSALEKYETVASSHYILYQMFITDRKRLESLLFRLLQHYSESFTIMWLGKKLASRDIGDFVDFSKKRDWVISRVDLVKELEAWFFGIVPVIALTDYTQEELSACTDFLRDMDCLVENSEQTYVLPFFIRYNYAEILKSVLINHFDSISGKLKGNFTLNNLVSLVESAIGGIILESIIFIDMLKSGHTVMKIRHNNRQEIDMFYNNCFYEVKHTCNPCPQQARWFIDEDLINNYHPEAFCVLYTGDTQNISYTVAEIKSSVSLEVFTEDYGRSIVVLYKNVAEFLLEET